MKLGAPRAECAYDGATATWTREFATGTKVTFDAKTNNGTVAWAGQ